MAYFDERVVLITGAAHGMGHATARKMAAAGAQVGLLDIDAEAITRLTTDLGGEGRAVPLRADVTQWDEVQSAVERLVKTFGKVTDLVNCAGGLSGLAHPQRRSIETLPLDEWDQAFALNVKSVFLCSRASVPHIRSAGGGCIVSVSSSAARQGSTQAGPQYVASKAAIIGLTRQMATCFATDHIRVNAIAPGGTESERFLAAMADRTPEEIERGFSRIPLHRHGQPDDMASAIYFLLSQEASYITGCTLDVNGGIWFA
jgi:NAD(P)-dependent dehydrogenase (short-subunit alcohol dehydrogenase family)